MCAMKKAGGFDLRWWSSRISSCHLTGSSTSRTKQPLRTPWDLSRFRKWNMRPRNPQSQGARLLLGGGSGVSKHLMEGIQSFPYVPYGKGGSGLRGQGTRR